MSDLLSNSSSPEQNKRALMVTGALARGGAERQMFALVEGLRARGWDVEVLELIGVTAGQASFETEFRKAGVALSRVSQSAPPRDDLGNAVPAELRAFAPLSPDTLPQICSALRRRLQDFRPDIVHCWSDLANVVGGFLAASAGISRIVLAFRTYPPSCYCTPADAELYREAYRTLLRHPAVLCLNNSKASRTEYERWIGIPSGQVCHVYNGFLASGISACTGAKAAGYRTRLGLPPDAVVVGGIMRFAPEKDPHLWLETVAAVAAHRPDVYFLLAGYGHGDIAEKLSQRGAELGLGDRLVMPGASDDVGAIYAALDVFLLTSRSENIPNVLIEAQAAGVSVVAPAVGGVAETMIDGLTGRLVAERSTSGLAAAVLECLNMRQAAVTAGPAFVAERFGHERMVTETLAVYERENRPAHSQPAICT